MASRTLRAITLARPSSFQTPRLSHLPRLPLPRSRYRSNRSNHLAYSMASISTSPPSTPAGKYEWLVVVPDKAGMQEKRLEVRAQHLEAVKPLAESGLVKTGGGLFNEKPEGEDASKFSFYGSTFVVVASSKEEILDLLTKDIYARSGVWDLDNVQIWPAKFAFRNP